MRIGKPRRLLDRRHGGAGPAIGDVLRQRAVKQDRVCCTMAIWLRSDCCVACAMSWPSIRIRRRRRRRAAAPVLQKWSCRNRSGRPGRRVRRRGCSPTARHTAARDGRVMERHILEYDAAALDIDRRASGASAMPIASSWMATSSSMSFTERCRLLMCMPTSRR